MKMHHLLGYSAIFVSVFNMMLNKSSLRDLILPPDYVEEPFWYYTNLIVNLLHNLKYGQK